MTIDRRTFLAGTAAAATAAAIPAATTTTPAAAATPRRRRPAALTFDPSAFTVKTEAMTTDHGTVRVTYRLYDSITYCTNPVDAAYQNITLKVPTSVDGVAVDASGAPIVLVNKIGGYMSSKGNADTGMAIGTGTTNGVAGVASGSGSQVGSNGRHIDNASVALAAGFVVAIPAARGRDNVRNGVYYGKAPAGIVDLKAAVRYLKANADRVPGNTDWIISSGSSAGGAYSALLGASGDSRLYDRYLREIGAADASDAVFASADYCPITDLEHADMAYEWIFRDATPESGTLDAAVSAELAAQFPAYQDSLHLWPKGFGPLTADTYTRYLLTRYLEPAATTYLAGLSSSKRATYLAAHPWISFTGGKASFTWKDFLAQDPRKKLAPAFDSLTLANAENQEFGTSSVNARHFTTYSLRKGTGDTTARLPKDILQLRQLMNPMYFIEHRNAGRSRHWWIRVGTVDSDTSPTIVANLAASLEALGDNVNSAMYWDAGHGTNNDSDAFMTWIRRITGYRS